MLVDGVLILVVVFDEVTFDDELFEVELTMSHPTKNKVDNKPKEHNNVFLFIIIPPRFIIYIFIVFIRKIKTPISRSYLSNLISFSLLRFLIVILLFSLLQ